MAGSVALAVVHGDPPEVFVADDMDVLHWVLALQWVARASGSNLPEDKRENLRSALLEERWADAVLDYMEYRGTVVDVFPSYDFYEARHVVLGAAELQFKPLFRD
jgi:hypothetical protein